MTKLCPDCGVEVSNHRNRCPVCKRKAHNAYRRAKYATEHPRPHPDPIVVGPVTEVTRLAKRRREDPRAKVVVTFSEPTPIDLELVRGFVYRCWGSDGVCLYVGKHEGIHPWTRVRDHQWRQPWWPEVARVDYVEILAGDVAAAEWQQIQKLRPRHNDQLQPVQEAA